MLHHNPNPQSMQVGIPNPMPEAAESCNLCCEAEEWYASLEGLI